MNNDFGMGIFLGMLIGGMFTDLLWRARLYYKKCREEVNPNDDYTGDYEEQA